MADGSRMVSALQIGTLVTQIALTAGVMLYVGGTLNVERQINFVTANTGGKTQAGTSTGVDLQENGTTQLIIHNTSCLTSAGTATGGLTKYDFCIAHSPLSTTGSLDYVSVECGNTPNPLTLSGGFVKAAGEVVGTALRNLTTVKIGSGAAVVFSTGSTYWNPADFLKIQTDVTTAKDTNCVLRYKMHDKYGN